MGSDRVLAVPEPLRDALAVHEAFRKLGFASGEIFIAPSAVGLQVVLRAQGLEFTVDVGPRSVPEAEYLALCRDRDRFARAWSAAVALWNGGFTDAEHERVWRDAPILGRSVELVSRLVAKGFVLKAGGWN